MSFEKSLNYNCMLLLHCNKLMQFQYLWYYLNRYDVFQHYFNLLSLMLNDFTRLFNDNVYIKPITVNLKFLGFYVTDNVDWNFVFLLHVFSLSYYICICRCMWSAYLFVIKVNYKVLSKWFLIKAYTSCCVDCFGHLFLLKDWCHWENGLFVLIVAANCTILLIISSKTCSPIHNSCFHVIFYC